MGYRTLGIKFEDNPADWELDLIKDPNQPDTKIKTKGIKPSCEIYYKQKEIKTEKEIRFIEEIRITFDPGELNPEDLLKGTQELIKGVRQPKKQHLLTVFFLTLTISLISYIIPQPAQEAFKNAFHFLIHIIV